MRAGTAESYQERINRVLAHIAVRLDAPLPLDELAAVANFSPFHFHRIFRGMVGESVKEHVRRLRLERAAKRLRDGSEPVTELAFRAGYQTHESFTRAFRAMFGEPPSSFRENRRELRAGQGAMRAGPRDPLDVRIERIGRMRLAYVRHTGPFDRVGIAWQKLYGWAGRNGLLGPGVKLVGVIQDDPEITPAERLRYDAAIAVNHLVQPGGEAGIQELPACEYAVTTHKGPYETLSDTYVRLCGEWLPASGREAAGAPSFEIYRNMPGTTRPGELITDIHLPLAE
ncbi:MAG: AraC family transcriptional regulator [Acidobacteriota bacterium]